MMLVSSTSYSALCTPPRLCFLPSLRLRPLITPTVNLQTARELKADTQQSEKRRQGVSVQASLKPDDSESEKDFSFVSKITGPIAALVVCALLSGSILPEEALAARSGGRMGGSAFRSRAPSMPRGGGGGGGRGFRQYNYYSSPGIAPPLVGGYGYGGFSIMPSFFFPIGFGGIFNIFITIFILSSIVNAIKSMQRNKDDEDDFDDML